MQTQSEEIYSLRSEIKEMTEDKEKETNRLKEEIKSLKEKLKSAIRGKSSTGDIGSAAMLLLLEEKLEGKVIITDKELENYQKWKNRRGIVKKGCTGRIDKRDKRRKGKTIRGISRVNKTTPGTVLIPYLKIGICLSRIFKLF